MLCIEAKKTRKLLWKHIVFANMKPRTVGDFFFMMARDWQLAKAAFGNQTQFVVVVENHPAAARHAKVFQQQITREQIAARQILDRLTIIEQIGRASCRERVCQYG